MTDDDLLSPRQAEDVIRERIEWFGLGALPQLTVTGLADGMWQVRWDHQVCTVAPMNRSNWHAWLERNVGSLDPGDLKTTES